MKAGGWGPPAAAKDQPRSCSDQQAIAASQDADTVSPHSLQKENFHLSLSGMMRIVRHRHVNTESY